MLKTRFCDLYGVEHPIVCAGMSFAGTPPLAVAVTEAGGIGSIGTGYLSPEDLARSIDEVRAGTNGPFNVNFSIFHEDEHIEVCAEKGVPIVSFHWRLPNPDTIRLLQERNVRVWQQIGTPEAAQEAADLGMDAVIAQGREAGGHAYGRVGTLALVPSVVDTVGPLPVLAAGGIADGRGVAAALALGAQAAYVGTRFVASKEANVHSEYKRRLVAATATDTELTSIFGPAYPEFNPMRVLTNQVVADFHGKAEVPTDNSDEPIIGYMTLGHEKRALRRFDFFPPVPDAQGDFEELPLLAGQGVGLVDGLPSAADLVRELANEAGAVIADLAQGSRSVQPHRKRR